MPVPRRHFIRQVATAVAAVPFMNRLAHADPEAGVGGGATRPTFHVFSKPFSKMSFAAAADLVAEAGFEGIDYLVRAGGHIEPERATIELPLAVKAAHAAGLKVEMITTGIRSATENHASEILQCAADLGIGCYRIGSFRYEAEGAIMDQLDRLRGQFSALAALNERIGIHGGYQNHSGPMRMGATGWDLHALIRELDPRWLGCQFDIRHATVEGAYAWPIALRLLRPWVRSVVYKDFRWSQQPGDATTEDTPIGAGIVRFREFEKALRDGPLPDFRTAHFEYPLFGHGEKTVTPDLRDQFLAAMKQDRVRLGQYV